MRPIDYAYGVGRIKVLENFLILEEVFEKAIGTDLNEALRLFVESDLYSANLLHVKNSRDLEGILDQELMNLKKLVSRLILDRELLFFLEIGDLKEARERCKKLRIELLENYINHLIDMNNIKTFLRLYVLKEPADKLDNAIACEGLIRKKDLLELYSRDIAALLKHLEYVHAGPRILDYTYYLEDAVRKTVKENSFISLEKAINDFLISILQQAKYIVFGPEPVLCYYYAKVNEINLIRMIILAKFNDITSDLVKERLNRAYA